MFAVAETWGNEETGSLAVGGMSAEEQAAVFFLSAASDCRPLEGGLRPAFACRTAEGHRFVRQ